jgi:hypothetical protein
MQDAYTEDSTIQLIVDQIEELIVTVIEEIRERPAVAGALFAAFAGVMIGSVLAGRGRRKAPPPGVVRKAKGIGQVGQIAATALSLLEFPLVRAIILNQLRKRILG